MNRIMKLQSALLREIDKYGELVPQRDQPVDWERVHISSCARTGYLLALHRNVDPELAAAACACHDYGRIVNGRQPGHAEFGYQPVMEFLRGTDLFSEEEIQQIGLAVKNHSRKDEVGSPLEEIVKDADVLDFAQYGFELPRQSQKDRLEALLRKGEITPAPLSQD